jgi:hypothetical protein
MLRLKSEITIGSLKFDWVANCQINSSWETLTDTAVIELPTNITNKDNEYIRNIIQVNDAVEIKLGYHPNLTTRFVGYVSEVLPESPLKVMCEDEAFQLKQSTVNNYSKKEATLNDVITDNYSGEVNIVDAVLGSFRIDRVTMVKVLQELKTKYKIFSWFRDGILNSGLAYLPGEGVTEKFDFQWNIINGRNLAFTDESELDTIAHGVSTQADGTKIELYTFYERGTTGNIITQEGNPGGDLNTIRIPDRTKEQLTYFLETWLPNLYYTGFKGSFETFGEPVVNHGDIAEIKDRKFPEKDGKYLIKSVQVKFGQRGYRQIIELDKNV